jgi:hypothetical protein
MIKTKIIFWSCLALILLFKLTLAQLPERHETVKNQRKTDTPKISDFIMVTDILDGFGGASVSTNYGIPVNSGGQPSAIGISESDNIGAEAGFIYASDVDRGDVNVDGIINVGDVVYLVSYLYRGGPEPCPVEAGDVTLDGIVNVGDIVYLISYLYRGGPPPVC